MYRHAYIDGKYRTILIHREILGLGFGDERQGDHINHNGLDNREDNLRVVTRQQNHFNCKSTKGYYWHKIARKWLAKIRINYKTIHLGYFDNKEDAHRAYLHAKKKYHKIE